MTSRERLGRTLGLVLGEMQRLALASPTMSEFGVSGFMDRVLSQMVRVMEAQRLADQLAAAVSEETMAQVEAIWRM